MAEKDINFRLNTTADTTGAEEVREALKETGEEVKKTGEEASQADPQLEKIINIQKAQVAAQIATALGQIGATVRKVAADFRESDPDMARTLENTARGLDDLTGAAAGAAQGFALGGPLGAAIGALTGLLTNEVKVAFQGMVTDLNNAEAAEKRAADMAVKLVEARRRMSEEIRRDSLTEFFRGELAELAEMEAAIARIAKIRESQRQLAAAERANAASAAVGTGQATDAQVAGREVVASTSQKIDEILQGVADLEQKADIAAQRANELQRQAERQDLSAADAERALATAQQAQAAADAARADADTAQQVAVNEVRTVLAQGTQAVREAGQDAGRALTEAVQQQRDALAAEVARLGPGASSNARAVVQILEQILADGQITADDQAKFAEAQGRLASVQERNNAQVAAAMQKSIELGVTFFEIATDLTGQMLRLQNEVGILRDQLRDLGSR